jgi:hypothetical protein
VAQRQPLDVIPVRISRGCPRFWPAAGRFPVVDELMPPGWVLGEKDDAKAEKGSRDKPHMIGVELIAARLDAIAAEYHGVPNCDTRVRPARTGA